MQFPALDSLLPVLTGMALYWSFPGWLVQIELEGQDVPKRNTPGSTSFLAGQATALMGVVALAGLLGLSLTDWVRQLHLQYLLLLSIGALVGLQGLWIALGMALHDSHESITRLSFETGRDLMLRHCLPLFLVLSLLIPMESAGVVRKELLGLLLGWATTNSLWGFPLGRTGQHLRKGLAFLCALACAYLLWKGWSIR